jgi:hypothetical protein
MKHHSITRPTLIEALAAWQECLAKHHLPVETLWIFAENVCIEPSRTNPGSFRTDYQTRFTPPAEDALEIAYDLFSETEARIVFYRLGSSPRGSVCVLLCDNWFEEKNARHGYERHDAWGISFHPGEPGEIDEITDLSRWLQRVKNGRGVQEFDFAMSLAIIDEVKIHGRPLHPYERFAENMVNRMRRVLGNPD